MRSTLALALASVLAAGLSAMNPAVLQAASATTRAPSIQLSGPRIHDESTRTVVIQARFGRIATATRAVLQEMTGQGWARTETFRVPVSKVVALDVNVVPREDKGLRVCVKPKAKTRTCSDTLTVYGTVDEPVQPNGPFTEEKRLEVIHRELDRLNARRAAAGVPPVELDTDPTRLAEVAERARQAYDSGITDRPGSGHTCNGYGQGDNPNLGESPPVDLDPQYTHVAIDFYWDTDGGFFDGYAVATYGFSEILT